MTWNRELWDPFEIIDEGMFDDEELFFRSERNGLEKSDLFEIIEDGIFDSEEPHGRPGLNRPEYPDPFEIVDEGMFDNEELLGLFERLESDRPGNQGKNDIFSKVRGSSGSFLGFLKREVKAITPEFNGQRGRFRRYRTSAPLPSQRKRKAPVLPETVGKYTLERSKWGNTKGNWLTKIVGLSEAALDGIGMEVAAVTDSCRLEMESQGQFPDSREMADLVSRRLIRKSAMRVAAVGGLTSAPAVLPVLGTIGTATGGMTADFVYLIRTHIELCYQIASAHGEKIDTEEMEAVVLALIGFVSSEVLVKDVVASTLNGVVEATAQTYLLKGIEAATFDVATVLSPKIFSRAFKILPLISIPMSASINIYSTYTVGKLARNYFSTNTHTTI